MSDFRPDTSCSRRSGSSLGRPITRSGFSGLSRPPQTPLRSSLSRMGTPIPNTARPTTSRGVSPGLSPGSLVAPIVADHPMTREGLSIMKTSSKGPQRQIMDKSYFMGQLRSKMAELAAENSKLQRSVEAFDQDNSAYHAYNKRAESFSAEIKDLQGELAVYNMLVDKLNVNADMEEVTQDYNVIKVHNDRKAEDLDASFMEGHKKEAQLKEMEVAIEHEQQVTDGLVQTLPHDKQERYYELKSRNEQLLQELHILQHDLDALTKKKDNLQSELLNSPIKQEAVALYGRLRGLELRRNQMLAEDHSILSPQEEREKFLKQVKENNQEIASLERQITGMKDHFEQDADIGELENDVEEKNQEERNETFNKLRDKEEMMDEFMRSFETNWQQEDDKKVQLEASLVSLLVKIGQVSGPSYNDIQSMQQSLDGNNTSGRFDIALLNTSADGQRLLQEFEKLRAMEVEVKTDLEKLRAGARLLDEELNIYCDLEVLRVSGEEKRKRLMQEKEKLLEKRDIMKLTLEKLKRSYEATWTQLQENEMHSQLVNLERKWQHHEQNNFVMKEFIATKSLESDYLAVAVKVKVQLSEVNSRLQQNLQ
uniref:Intraflagellar transport 74 n=1 Tax=Eptatretus burgeri TaxID=7764 RepID=A0A8C4NH31_EPTBU